jgi:tRNA 2-thiouridine synthesizing protein A
MADQTLDCIGLSCPMPIVKISRAVKQLTTGQTLEIEASDRAFEADIRAWSAKTGNPIVSFTGGDTQCATIQKA